MIQLITETIFLFLSLVTTFSSIIDVIRGIKEREDIEASVWIVPSVMISILYFIYSFN